MQTKSPNSTLTTFWNVIYLQVPSLSALCEKLLDHCLAPTITPGEGCDNMTVIIVQLKQQH